MYIYIYIYIYTHQTLVQLRMSGQTIQTSRAPRRPVRKSARSPPLANVNHNNNSIINTNNDNNNNNTNNSLINTITIIHTLMIIIIIINPFTCATTTGT